MKTHFIAEEKPILQWPDSIHALCGAEVKQPRGVLTLDLEIRELRSVSTIRFCEDCVPLAFGNTKGKRWIYGIMNGEEAHRANLANRMED